MAGSQFVWWRKYFGEFLGAFSLLLFGGGAAVFSLPAGAFEPLARVVLVSMAFGFGLAGLIYALGEISGGHYNPAVTISLALSGRFPARDVVPYILCQVIGGIVGMLVVLGIVLGGPSSIVSGAEANALGSQSYSMSGAPGTFTLASVFLIEVALTFVFIMVIQLATRAETVARFWAPAAIGFALLVTNLVAIPVDGASMNPVRSFSPAVVSLYWPSEHWAIVQSWLFWVAPIIGGAIAAGVERFLRVAPVPEAVEAGAKSPSA
jgi:aquaporin Z